MKRPRGHLAGPAFAGLLFLALWVAVKALFGLNRFVLPGPGEVATALWEERTALLAAAGWTLQSALAGVAAAALLGFALAVVLGLSGRLRASFYPWALVLQMTPVVILVPVFKVLLGPENAFTTILLTAFLISFFPVVANTTAGLLSVERSYRELFTLYGASRWQRMRHLQIPHALPAFFTGLRIAASLGVIGALTGEMFAGTSAGGGGLGFRVLLYAAESRVAEVFATAAVACALGFLLVGAVVLVQGRLLRRWHPTHTPPEH